MLAQCELSPSRHLIPGATNKDLHNSVIQNCLSNQAEGSIMWQGHIFFPEPREYQWLCESGQGECGDSNTKEG